MRVKTGCSKEEQIHCNLCFSKIIEQQGLNSLALLNRIVEDKKSHKKFVEEIHLCDSCQILLSEKFSNGSLNKFIFGSDE